jgi:putative uncharacterized protein SPs1170
MDKEELKQKNNQKLEEATDKMKEITNENPEHFKTKRLGSSMGNYATQLERDVKGHRRRNPVFKHGTLVYVDFGINYGSEFSSYHYAITLTKNDTKSNNTITVVPLTSKIGKQNIKINHSISVGLAAFTLSYRGDYLELNANKKIVANIKTRLDKYIKDLDKDTYIKIDAITTIDKNKIFKPKDDLDPLTRVRVSDEVLELIKEGIKNLFFKSN